MVEMVEVDLFCGWQPATTPASTARKQNTRIIGPKAKRFLRLRKIAARNPDCRRALNQTNCARQMKKNGTSTRKAAKTPPFAARAERAARNVKAESRAFTLPVIVWQNG
jgi:hypothetical protein